MQFAKWIGKWSAVAIALLLAFGLLWPWMTVVKERLSAGEYTAYLADHSRPLDLTQADGNFGFPDRFYENRLFLLGEIHGAQVAQDLDLAMMVHLNRRVGMTDLMAELSPVQAERFNAYLDSGDTSYLAPVFEDWQSGVAQWANQQHYDKLLALREYNQSQPEDRRLRYFGVDLIRESQQEDAARWLGLILADESNLSSEAIVTLRDTALGPFDKGNMHGALEQGLPALVAVSRETGSADLAMAHYIGVNLLASMDGAGRYDVIPLNIRAMVEDFDIGDDEPIYGFWGIFHVLKAQVNETAVPMALKLANSDLPFADAIGSVTMVYADSTQNMPSRALPEILQDDGPYTEFTMSQDNPYLMYLYGIGDLKRITDAKATLFYPYEAGSPYLETRRLKDQSGLLTYVYRFEIADTPEPAFDHVILIEGGQALTPWVAED